VLLYGESGLTAGSIYATAGVRVHAGTDDATVTHIDAGSLRDALTIRAVVVPRIDGDRTRLDPIAPALALRAWAPSSALRLPFDDGEVVATMARLVKLVPCFALSVGHDQAAQAGAIAEALTRSAIR
jgi:hypothetical protein